MPPTARFDGPRSEAPRILVLSGYDAASHRRWREQLVAMFSDFEWQSLLLPARFFRWRIRGNPLSWLNEPLLQEHWDLIIATSMVDLATLRGLHPRLANTPSLLYMHENQFAFPVSNGQNASADPQMVNLYSAMSADCVVFNSGWNRDSFLDGVDSFCRKLPDRVPEGLIETLRDKSRVIPVPIEDRLFADRPLLVDRTCPHLLWNHRWECKSLGDNLKLVWASRWEYDKGPAQLLAFLEEIESRGIDYRLCLIGEQFRKCPEEFEIIKRRYAHRLAQFGYVASRDEYIEWLRTADVVLSTALHEFQGIAVLEAVASGCAPLVPNRLSYPELFGEERCYGSFPNDLKREASEAADKLEEIRNSLTKGVDILPDVSHVSASALGSEYRALIESLISGRQP